GRQASYICIGRAGEFRLAAASIALTDMDGQPSRHAGRGGVGAVMGSKGLKAIVINPAGAPAPSPADPEGFSRAARCFARALKKHPVCGQMAAYGSAAMMNLFNEAGALPTRNFSAGRFENPEAVSGERLNRLTRERGGEGRVTKGCMSGCLIRCSGVYPDRNGKRIGKWPDYETLWAFGPNTGIDDLDMIARYDRLCDDIGVDTIDVGSAIALMMEAGWLKFGDAAGALKLVEEISAGTMTGRVIGNGAAVTGRVLGLNRVPQVKGQAMSAFDPRSVKGQGVAFATNPQGADHTAGLAYAANLLAIGGDVDPLAIEGQVEVARAAQISAAAVDTLGLCLFVSFAVFETPSALEAIADMLNARYGWSRSVGDLAALGRRVLDMELDFNRRAGFTAADDRLPEFFAREKVGPHDSTFDITEADLDRTLRWHDKPGDPGA
ncbi:MAG: aldehyde ferredoxin oxidoreductase, partial [Candidatus Adiutrix sp.]|nr:aldehyde ferredoxin oxidoreductase [Candidatus Adiutrix sp.]